MQLPILEKQCPECKGEKYYYNPIWKEYWEMVENRRDELIKEECLEYTEAFDRAEKQFIDKKPNNNEPEECFCSECEGKGTVLTDEGIEIMRIVKKYLE
jgi:hypothetical protein